MYTVKPINITNISGLLKVADILYKCGKDMSAKYDLHHWDNPRIKNWIIVFLCALKNEIYLVYCGEKCVATFQTRKKDDSLLFQKLATSPDYAGKGIGSFCLDAIEDIGRKSSCKKILCEVFDKSEHAKAFYEKRGYTAYGETTTLKYREIKLKKDLR